MKFDTTRVPSYRSLSVKLMAVLALVVVAAFATVGYLTLLAHSQQSIALVGRNLDTLVDTVRASTRYHMLRAAHQDAAEIVRTIGRQREVERIRVIAKDGRVWMSGRPGELGVVLSVRDPACAGCHRSGTPKPSLELKDRMNTYERDGRSYMTVIRPIYNEPECSSAGCHVHPAGQRVLGIIDMGVRLDPLRDALRQSRVSFIAISTPFVVVIPLLVGVYLWMNVHRPVHRILAGIDHVAHREPAQPIALSVTQRDELGLLALAFDQMVCALEVAEGELKSWGHTLEQRVDQKTAELRTAEQELKRWTHTLEARVAEKTRELRLVETHIARADRLASLGKLAADVAHELNNPISGVLTYVQLIRRRIAGGKIAPADVEQYQKHMAVVETELRRCGEIVKDLLIFAKDSSAAFAPAALREVIESALAVIRPKLDASPVMLSVQIASDVPTVCCEKNQIQQVLMILLINAIEAMPDSGRLVVRCSAEPGWDGACISVEDSGPGLPASIRGHLFEPFMSTKDEASGVGLGLSIAQAIVRKHGGRIEAECPAAGGTVFRVWLPRAPQEDKS
jgi:two-component system, NtrC family, sensor kinase